MQEGISLEEACVKHAVGNQDDFERNCNPDGTVKKHSETTTFTLNNDENMSVTINNTYLYIAIVGISLIALIVTLLVVRKILKKRSVKIKYGK
jgi:hypothetical protein